MNPPNFVNLQAVHYYLNKTVCSSKTRCDKTSQNPLIGATINLCHKFALPHIVVNHCGKLTDCGVGSGNQDLNVRTKSGQMSQCDRDTQTHRHLDIKIAPYPTGRTVCNLGEFYSHQLRLSFLPFKKVTVFPLLPT